MPLPSEKEHYTYADYLEWDCNERYELINGEAVMMAGSTGDHQLISSELMRQFTAFLYGKLCWVLHAPFDVRLFEKDTDNADKVDTVVQPDLFVLCGKSKRDKRGVKGAPQLVIEILSPSTQVHDCFVKLNLYQQAGVPEYWIIDPESKTVNVLILGDNGIFQIPKVYKQTDTIKVSVLDGCVIELEPVFAEEWLPE